MVVTRKVPKGTRIVGGRNHDGNMFGVTSLDFPDMPGTVDKGVDGVVNISVISDVANIRYLSHVQVISVNGPFEVPASS